MKTKLFFNLVLLVVLFVPSLVAAQTTEFTYYGTLDDSSAKGAYDFEFRLFDLETGGTPLAIQQRLGVTVTNGNYKVRLDFGDSFPGAARFLEIGYKNLPGPFTTISPREPVTSVPYAVRSLSAGTADQVSTSCVGCVADANINQVSGNKITGAIPVSSIPSGSDDYIQNTTTTQPDSNFSISGTGTADTFNATTQYNIHGYRFIFAGTFPGVVPNQGNVFVGFGAGQNTPTGLTTGNSFFGTNAGQNTGSHGNSFFGMFSGKANTAGLGNSFFGSNAGNKNTTGHLNTAIGSNADFISSNMSYATAIGADAIVQSSNTIALGRKDGSDTVRVPGKLALITLGTGGAGPSLCRNLSGHISACSSSLRYKTDIAPFNFGLQLVNRLRPITFSWKGGGLRDLGLGAEDVAAKSKA